MGRTLLEKVWDRHVIDRSGPGQELLYIDTHLVHEVSSPQAFSGLRDAGRVVRRPGLTLATLDHSVPTAHRDLPIPDLQNRAQVEALIDNCKQFGIPLFGLGDPRQGIVHMIGPELGLTVPGATIVCGDSHTATHGAFGALAFGIGTSEVEHVLATQTLRSAKPKTFAVEFAGELPFGCTAKDVVLALIREIGTAGGVGHAIEYRGPLIERLSMEARMTICNMSIEAGARAGMVAPDETTFAYLEGRPFAPKGVAWDAALEDWRSLPSDADAVFDKQHRMDVSDLEPTVTWGTTPAMSVGVTGRVPVVDGDEQHRVALEYMGLEGGESIVDIPIDRVFIGSCTNARYEDLWEAAQVVEGSRVAARVRAMIVPGSTAVKVQAEAAGLDRIFKEAGFEWRDAGCSMCIGMNADSLEPGERCASTSNRNFQGRQGPGGRTHLVSPSMAAAAAIHGHFVDVRGER